MTKLRHLDLDNFQVRLQYWVASLCNQLLPEFSSNQFEILHRCYKHIEDVHVTFSRQENNFDKITTFWTDNFQVRLQYGVASLCNQLLPEFSSNQFEILHRCYKHIEDVHVTFSRQENNFDKITTFWTDNLLVRLQYGVASLCNQLLPEFSSNQFETFHRCYKHIENVHVTFSRQENHF